MSQWKPIESAPIGKSILVDGGTLNFEVVSPPEAVTEPVKVVQYVEGGRFEVQDGCYYCSWVENPLFWTELPERHSSLAPGYGR